MTINTKEQVDEEFEMFKNRIDVDKIPDVLAWILDKREILFRKVEEKYWEDIKRKIEERGHWGDFIVFEKFYEKEKSK